MNHAAHVLATGEGPLDCKDAGCDGHRAARGPRCPRCQMGYLIRDLDGDASCYVCGVVLYRTAPDDRKPTANRAKCGRVTL